MPTEGYLALVLHSHLPYLINHGVWPHGLDWLHEATAETYVPLLGALKELDERGLQARFTINLTPILLEQLEHPSFEAEFPKYVDAKIEAARKDQAEFQANGRLLLYSNTQVPATGSSIISKSSGSSPTFSATTS
jgi:1,4-alpha-glucan branching enzyme